MKVRLILFLLFCSASAFSQSGYKINFKIKGWKDITTYLFSFSGEQTYVKDTANVNSNGEFSFDDKNKLPHGVYFLVLKKDKGNMRMFDFVVSEDQFFTLETDTSGFEQHMKVTGDEDNKLFFEYGIYNVERNKEAEPFRKILKDSTLNGDQKKDAKEALNKIRDKVLAHQRDVISKHPKTMTARMLKSSQVVSIPDPPKLPNGKIDSTFRLRYYRKHFFDNFDLSDDALIHLPQPLYQQKLKEYLQLFVPQPDTITKAINELVPKAKKNRDTYQYLMWRCLVMYQLPEIMGLDEVFVNLYDQYVATGEMDFWMAAKTKQDIKEYANKIRSSMIGRTGANLIMQDENFQPKSMYDIKAKYTILFIFKPSCSHCREETPKLVDFYTKDKTKFNFEVFAVSTDTSMKEMRDFIKEFKTPWITVNGPRFYKEQKEHFSKLYHADTTPTIFILDDKKKIIAKKLPVEQLEDFLTKHEKFLQTKKTNDVSNGAKRTSGQ
jgi:thiol-disulfide isomerase/thioredoxin